MKKFLTTLGFCLALSIGASAQMIVDKIELNQGRDWHKGKAPTISVRMHNPGPNDQVGNYVELDIRINGEQSWRTLKTWKLDQARKSGQSITLGFDPARE